MDYDDWIFESIKKYKNLSIYDMQQSVTAMDWVTGKSLCIGTSTGQKHEILELMLPDKMLESEEAARAKLNKDRDFRVQTGGFCQSRVTDLKHLPGTRNCVTACDGKTSVSRWKMGDSDTDLMIEEKSVHAVNSTNSTTRIAVYSNGKENQEIAFGSSVNNITVLDAERFERVTDCSGTEFTDQLSSMFYQSANILHSCTSKGDIYTCDFRCDKMKVTCCHSVEREQQGYWTMTKLNDQSESVLLTSTLGDVILTDLRLKEHCMKRKIDICQTGNKEYFCVQASPDGSKFSVSGLDGMVYIYNSLQSASNKDSTERVFVHEGHVMNSETQPESVIVVKHMWHPWQQDLIISTATDSSLHAWQYNPS